MGRRYAELSAEHIDFIRRQKIFFVATAPEKGYINLSPKGIDSFRMIDATHVAWLNLTGSGNETAAHVLENGRMTVMFCSFEGDALILRLYGTAQVIHPRDSKWKELDGLFPALPGVRQIFELSIDLVQTSCGYGVPRYAYIGDREDLTDGWREKGPEGVAEYWRKNNTISLDGKDTGILGQEAR